MSQPAVAPKGGRAVVAAVWAASGVTHAVLAFRATAVVGATVSTVLAVAAAIGVIALLLDGRQGILLACAVAGAIGLASFVVPLLVPGFPEPTGGWTDPWLVAAFLLDGLAVRVAVFTLRRGARAQA